MTKVEKTSKTSLQSAVLYILHRILSFSGDQIHRRQVRKKGAATVRDSYKLDGDQVCTTSFELKGAYGLPASASQEQIILFLAGLL